MKTTAAQPRLLVPIDIEALFIGKAAAGSDWLDLKPNFRGVYYNQFLGDQFEKQASTIRKNLLPSGIHLHWALPDGLMHGSAAGGNIEFPLIPNRWLIVRFWDRDAKISSLDFQHKAWIVESDTIAGEDDKTAQPWPTLRSAKPNRDNPQDYYVLVGKRYELAAWPGETSAPNVAITSIGYGDPCFAAYYPACRGILGFHDLDLENLEAATLNYFVCGWYSGPADDPLYQAISQAPTGNALSSLDAFLSQRKWTYPGFADALSKAQQAKGPQEIEAIENRLPAHIVCHGVIAGIQPNKGDLRIPRSQPFRVSLGNTSVEALTALFRNKLSSDGLARLLEAFQYDLFSEFDKPDGAAIVEQKLHERRYRPLSRGIRWDLIQENPNGAASEQAPPIPGDIRLLLEKLNARQRTINALMRKRDSARSQLYATWYKTALNPKKDAAAEVLNRQLTDLQKEIDDAVKEIARNEELKQAEFARLQEQLEVFLPGYTRQELEEPRFWRPNDPVVLLEGKAFERSSRYGEDGLYRKDGRLLCRLSGDAIVKLKTTVPFASVNDVEFGPAKLDAWCSPFFAPDRPQLPADIPDLFRESLLLTLDEKRARRIALAAYKQNGVDLETTQDPQQLEKLHNLSRNLLSYLQDLWRAAGNPEIEDVPLRRELQNADGETTVLELQGKFPSPIMLKSWERNPWIPLLLQWKVAWEPAYTDPLQALKDWQLSKPEGTSFTWRPNGRRGNSQSYSGTTLLTPSATTHLTNRLRDYMRTHTGVDANRTTFQDVVSSMEVLCQSLGGLTDGLLTRKARLELQPLDPGADGHGPQPSSICDQVKEIDWLSPLTDGGFFPVRAGQLRFESLWVIDAFGQLLQLDDGPLKKLICARQLESAEGYARLEPRLAQPARLTMEWPPARASRSDSGSSQDAQTDAFNPVCGWILPNFLDSSLMIYDDRGYALGALQAVRKKSWEQGAGGEGEEIESFHWIDIPGSDGFFFGLPPKSIDDPLGSAANPHLRQFVKGLLSLAEGAGQAFSALLEKLNEALSASGGAGSRQDPNLALLIGKPLALVRARLRLELDGSPAYAQPAGRPDAERTGKIEAVKFPVRLGDRRKWNDMWIGDDGLAGFFLNQDYTRFFPAWGLGAEGTSDHYSTYGHVPSVSIAEPLDLTLLMDISRGVSATSGILPQTVFQLPYGDMTETMESKQVIFFTGPVISPKSGKNNAQIYMPRPSDIYGQWSWTHHPDVKVWSEGPIVQAEAEDGYFPEAPLEISEGWLKLVTAPLAVRVLTVKGKNAVDQDANKPAGTETTDQFWATPGERIVLSWATVGADSVELLRDGSTSLFQSSRHPLPAQYQVQVDRDTSFTLIATARADKLAATGPSSERRETKTIAVKLKPLPRA